MNDKCVFDRCVLQLLTESASSPNGNYTEKEWFHSGNLAIGFVMSNLFLVNGLYN